MDAKTALAQLAIVLAEVALQRDQYQAESAALRSRVAELEAQVKPAPEVPSRDG